MVARENLEHIARQATVQLHCWDIFLGLIKELLRHFYLAPGCWNSGHLI